MSDARHAVVVGGGVGGLASAIGLRLAGLRVTVLERAPAFAEVGSGITLWPNALRGLRALGLDPRIAGLRTERDAGGLRDRHGRRLAHWDSAQLERALGGPLLALRRAQLIDMLRDALPSDVLRTGVTVTDVRQDGLVCWDNGEINADIVIGADGIHSGVRARLWPTQPGVVYCGSTAFRAVLDDASASGIEPGITLGPGAEVGMVPLIDNRLYWYIAVKAPAGTRPDPKSLLLRRFRSWHADVRELIDRTPAERISHDDLYQLAKPLSRYHLGKVALLGDAAHAMPPFLGQGGCQAIEDAVELAAALAESDDSSSGLARYDQRRRPRSQLVARRSVRAGKFGAQLSRPVAVAARDTIARMLPSRLSSRLTAATVDWKPPAIVRGR